MTTEYETQAEIDVDPICGMTVDRDQAREHELAVVFAEREYRFCGPICRDAFLGDPIRYSVAGRDHP